MHLSEGHLLITELRTYFYMNTYYNESRKCTQINFCCDSNTTLVYDTACDVYYLPFKNHFITNCSELRFNRVHLTNDYLINIAEQNPKLRLLSICDGFCFNHGFNGFDYILKNSTNLTSLDIVELD